ncbi:MAG TPA: ABC transporter permease, partial [Cyclobacteriaceae bacterium]
MLKNYIKIAYRNLLRHKSYSFINILGLAVGMACAILIMIWVQFELSYEQFNIKADRLYRITAELPDLDVKAGISSAPLADAFRKELPEIKDAVRLSVNHSDLLQVEDRMFEEKRIWFVDSTFLEMFSFKMIQGDLATSLDKPESIILTESMAKKYFGSEPALGKTIRKNHKEDFIVTGVLADLPENTQLQFDFLQPMSFLARTNNDLKTNKWDNFNFFTFLEFNESFQPSPEAFDRLEKKFNSIYKANEPNLKVVFHLQKLTDMHLHSNNFLAELPGIGNMQYVYIFIVVGIFILVVACINFMNLATARSARRAKEVGLRKVAGAARFQLIRQFLAESSLIAFIALALAVLIVTVSLPAFNDLAGKKLLFEFYNPTLILSLLGITLVTGLLAGSYPALFLSGFVPAKVLKGNIKAGAASSMFRNSMVVIQFSVSIILLVGTGVVYNQLEFI